MPQLHPSRLLRWGRSKFDHAFKHSEKGTRREKGSEEKPLVEEPPDPEHPSEPSQKGPSRYIYEKLDGPDMIRTMKLHATKDRIECSLQQISLSDGGFQTLSYVWGSHEKPFRATVLDEDGNELGYIPLTLNLQLALCDLRDAEGLKSKVFWIDQICIDQEGDEKNHQVALMGQIYPNSTRVITYVGPAVEDEEEERRGIDLLRLLDEHFKSNYELIGQEGHLSKARDRTSELSVLELPSELQDARNENLNDDRDIYIAQGWRWLLQVTYGEWTQRLWMVQEQLLNSEIVMLHGSSLLSWDAVTSMPLLFYLELLPNRHVRRFWRENRRGSIQVPEDVEQAVYTLWYRRRRLQNEALSIKLSLFSNMAMYEDLYCWDSRDRIFAMLSISDDATELGITPDYSERSPASRVYLETSLRILQSSLTLDLLTYASSWANLEASSGNSDPRATLVTPSWALCPPHEPKSSRFLTDTLKAHPRSSLSAPLRFRLNQSVLVLKGRFVDRISMSTSAFVFPNSAFIGLIDKEWIQGILKALTNWVAVLLHLRITLDNVACLCRAIVCLPAWPPTAQERHSMNENAAYHFWCDYRVRLNLIKRHAPSIAVDIDPMIEQWNSLVLELVPILGGKVEPEQFQLSRPVTLVEDRTARELRKHAILHGRSFCVTEHARVCNAMNQAKKGDFVAALQGSDKLWILRPAGDRYRLIGDAYVEGLMRGEAYDGFDPDEVDHDIELV